MAMDGVSLEGLGPESPPFKYLKGTDTKSAQNVLKTHKNRGFRLIHIKGKRGALGQFDHLAFEDLYLDLQRSVHIG